MNNLLHSWDDFLSSNVDGWDRNNLGNLFSHRKEKNHTDLPLLAVTGSGGVVPRDSLERRDTSNVDKSKYLRVCIGDIAYNTMRMWQGVSGLSTHEGIVSPAYTICSPKNGISSEYMSYLFKLPQLVQVFHSRSQGLVDDTLNLKFENFSPIVVKYPPLPEQQKIAAILSSVDDVIEKTQAQIDKLKDLKTGMMQELLTKGIGHTEFKDSPVGRIPAGWDVVTLESLLANVEYPMRSGPFGSSLLKHELVENGIPYLGIDNVHVERFEKNYRRFVSDDKFRELERYAVRENDVMVTIMGTVGRCCVVPKGVGQALSSKHVWTMTFDLDKYLPELICWQINYATWVEDQFKNESQGGVMESISSKTLRSLLIPLPPIKEQKQIAEAHTKISKTISKKSENLVAVKHLKKALMQDLLTGKVRVKVD